MKDNPILWIIVGIICAVVLPTVVWAAIVSLWEFYS